MLFLLIIMAVQSMQITSSHSMAQEYDSTYREMAKKASEPVSINAALSGSKSELTSA